VRAAVDAAAAVGGAPRQQVVVTSATATTAAMAAFLVSCFFDLPLVLALPSGAGREAVLDLPKYLSSCEKVLLFCKCRVFSRRRFQSLNGRHVFVATKWLDRRRAACAVWSSPAHIPSHSLPQCRRGPLPVSIMGRPSASPADGGGAIKPNTKGGAKGGAKGGSKATGKKAGAKAGGGGAPSTAAATPTPPAVLLPSLPVPILKLSLTVPSPLAAPSASSCGGAALGALSAALVDVAGRPQPTGDVRRTLGGAVAEWVKALGGVGDGGGGGVVDNVGRYVAAEISALPADEEGGSGAAGDASANDAGALGELLGKKLHDFGERRIEAACQAVGTVVAESVLQSGDEVVVWGVGSQPEVVAALERYVALALVALIWLCVRSACT